MTAHNDDPCAMLHDGATLDHATPDGGSPGGRQGAADRDRSHPDAGHPDMGHPDMGHSDASPCSEDPARFEPGDAQTTFHGSFEPATFNATRAWFCVEVEDDEGVHSCGGTFTSLGSPGDAENWIKAEARERGFDEVIWDTREPTRG